MPYQANGDLPESVSSVLPEHAQSIFREAFNHAYNEYKSPKERRGKESREEVAFKVAWAAVKKKYAKGADDKWHPTKQD